MKRFFVRFLFENYFWKSFLAQFLINFFKTSIRFKHVNYENDNIKKAIERGIIGSHVRQEVNYVEGNCQKCDEELLGSRGNSNQLLVFSGEKAIFWKIWMSDLPEIEAVYGIYFDFCDIIPFEFFVSFFV